MTIRRYVASADTTITDAYKENLILRGTGSNMGASDSMEVFSLYGQITTSSLERTRALVKFPIDSIISDRAIGLVPTSGNVGFYLRLFNAEHPFSLPKDYYMSVHPLSQSWDEGYGLDMENYSDPGQGMGNGYGTNWIKASTTQAWDYTGSSFITGGYDLKYHFVNGYEDMEVDITSLTEQWISGQVANNGLVVKLSGSYEDGSQKKSFYTKKFFTRGSQFFYKRPIIEVRWEDAVKDDRGDFYATSTLLSDTDNTYSIFLYNRLNGKLKNIPNNPTLSLKLYTDKDYNNELTPISCSITNPTIGVYKASLMLYTTASALYDKWYKSGSAGTVYYSSSFDINHYSAQDYYSSDEYVYSITNLKTRYNKDENATIRIFSRLRDWSPNVYSVATKLIENTVIKNLYYKIFRVDDGYEVVGYSTGSIGYTKTSYDGAGNYFNFDMSLLEPDHTYAVQLARYDGSVLEEFKQTYKFRVE
jgi:hypothetical protein